MCGKGSSVGIAYLDQAQGGVPASTSRGGRYRGDEAYWARRDGTELKPDRRSGWRKLNPNMEGYLQSIFVRKLSPTLYITSIGTIKTMPSWTSGYCHMLLSLQRQER